MSAEFGGLALVGLEGALHRRGGGDVPVTRVFTGGSQGDALDLNGSRTGVGEVGGDAEGLAGNGGGEGILRHRWRSRSGRDRARRELQPP